MRLIDADALVAAYDAAHDGPPGKARTLIMNAPTVDAMPVVWCKDCKYRYREMELCKSCIEVKTHGFGFVRMESGGTDES